MIYMRTMGSYNGNQNVVQVVIFYCLFSNNEVFCVFLDSAGAVFVGSIPMSLKCKCLSHIQPWVVGSSVPLAVWFNIIHIFICLK